MSDEVMKVTEEDIIRTRREQGLELSDEEKEQYRKKILATLKEIDKQLTTGETGLMLLELRSIFHLNEYQDTAMGIVSMIQKLEKEN